MIFTDARSKFGRSTVIAVYRNFVEVDTLVPVDESKTAAILVKSGTTFDIVLPPMDDRAIRVRVLAVGEIRGKTEASTKYRGAVVQRKLTTDSSWGVLETLDASALPDSAHCEVRMHTRPRMHAIIS